MSQTAYWPWPPDCLTCRPWPLAPAPNVSRSATLTGSVSSSTPPERSRSSTTSACDSPMHQSTSWWVSGLRSRRSVGSPATSRARFLASASSSERVLATTAIGSSGSGIVHGSMSSGLSLPDRVSPVSALPDLVIAQMSPAMQYGTSRSCRAERRVDVRHPLVGVVVGVAALGQAVPGDVHGLLRAQGAGEDPDQRDPADVPVDRGLDHLGHQRAVRVAGQRRARRAVHPGDHRQVVLQRRRARR